MENTDQKIVKTNRDKLSKCRDIFDILYSIFFIFGIIGAGYWFIHKGQIRPKAEITHDIIWRNIYKDKSLINMLVNIKNIGETPIDIRTGIVRLQQIIPLKETLIKDIDNEVDIIDKDYGIVLWPYACEKEKAQHEIKEPVYIEVGETKRVDYDFIIPSNINTIKVYSYFEDPNNGGKWRRVTIWSKK